MVGGPIRQSYVGVDLFPSQISMNSATGFESPVPAALVDFFGDQSVMRITQAYYNVPPVCIKIIYKNDFFAALFLFL
jgi:hypothetical protein